MEFLARLLLVALLAIPVAVFYGDKEFNEAQFYDTLEYYALVANFHMRQTTPTEEGIFAAGNNYTRFAVHLINDVGADVNKRANDYKGNTMMHIGCLKNNYAILEAALQKGGNPNVRDTKFDNIGYSPLMYCAQAGNPRTTQLLLDWGGDVNLKETEMPPPKEHASMALHKAALSGSVATAEVLVEAGAVIDAKGPNENTPAHLAAMRRDLAMVKFFVEAGIDLNLGDADGQTVLHHAAKFNALPIIKYLIGEGADPSKENRHGDTPLMVSQNMISGTVEYEGVNSKEARKVAEYLKTVTPAKKRALRE